MMKSAILKSVFLVASVVGSNSVVAADDGALHSEKDKLSYAIGYNIGANFKKDSVDFDKDSLLKGLEDAIKGAQPYLTEKEMKMRMAGLQAEIRKQETQRQRIAAEDNRQKGVEFMADYGKKQGVIKLASGLQYKIIKAGSGAKPGDNDSIVCYYKGTLIDGAQFDGTDTQPATLKIASLIPGWKEAIKLMPVGSKWQIVIPANLAYGARGVGQEIGPNATLIFDVELLEIKS